MRRSGHSPDTGGAATRAASSTRNLCSINVGGTDDLGKDGAATAVGTAGAAPVKGHGRRSRINTGGATDAGTGGAAEAGSTAPTLSSGHRLGSINIGSVANAGGAVPVKGPGRGRSRINTGGATDAGTEGAAEAAVEAGSTAPALSRSYDFGEVIEECLMMCGFVINLILFSEVD